MERTKTSVRIWKVGLWLHRRSRPEYTSGPPAVFQRGEHGGGGRSSGVGNPLSWKEPKEISIMRQDCTQVRRTLARLAGVAGIAVIALALAPAGAAAAFLCTFYDDAAHSHVVGTTGMGCCGEDYSSGVTSPFGSCVELQCLDIPCPGGGDTESAVLPSAAPSAPLCLQAEE
jgi:hypothetical protein